MGAAVTSEYFYAVVTCIDCLRTCVYLRVCLCVCVCMFVGVSKYVCASACACVCLRVCMCMCANQYVSV